MKTILIRNALIVTQDESRRILKGDMLIEGNRISKIGEVSDSADTVINAGGNAVLPGFINTHAHVAMAHLKGLLDDISLENFLEKTFLLDANRSDKGIYNSAMLGMAEMIDSGITSFHDLYYSEDIIARAASRFGIRAFLAWNTLDDEFTTQSGSPLKNAESFIRKKHGDLVTPSVGVQGIYVASDETYRGASEIARKYDTTIHTHLSETRKEVYDYAAAHNGQRPVEHLLEIGFLDDRLIAAHSSFVTMREVRQLAKANVKVSWNSISNCKLGTGGMPPVPEMLDHGITVSLGTDSNGSNNSLNMLEMMKFSSLLVKNARWNPAVMNAQKILDMATRDAASSLRRTDIGVLKEGNLADLIMIDLKQANLIPAGPDNIVQGIVYSANPANVDTVIVNGKILKKGKKLRRKIPETEKEKMI
ncbi:MAG: amidohydrolase family protein [Candidatus Thermoplasmatota archaeon]|nr:amidohydrolase family protein [Candidatus Thermoplasmatota archaeon]